MLKNNFLYIDNEFLSPFLKNIPLVMSLLGFFLGLFLITKFQKYIKLNQNFYIKI